MGMWGWWCTRTLFNLRHYEPRNPYTPTLISGRRHYNSDAKGHNFPNFKPKWWVQRRKVLFALFLGSSATTIYLCNQEIIPYTNRTHLVFMSPETEILVSEAVFKQLKQDILKGNLLAADHPKTLRANSIAQNLIKALEDGISQVDPDFATYHQFKLQTRRTELSWKRGRVAPATRHMECLNWEVFVVNSPLTDVYCIPGGKILVYDGVFYHFETDAQIAALIAHQVGHLVARHMVERMAKEIYKTIPRKLLYYVVRPSVIDMMSFLKFRPFSTKVEVEAQYIGLMLMASAGYDPNEAVITMEKLRKVPRDLRYKPCMLRSEVHSQTHAMEKALKLYRAKNEIAKLKD